MDDVNISVSSAENVTFFYEAATKATTYRLSFAQKAANNHQALESELPNLWRAARQSYEQKAWAHVMAFRDTLQSFLDLRGYWGQSLQLNEWAIEAAQIVGDEASAARWTHDRADILNQQGRYLEAEQLYRASETAFRAIGEDALALKSRQMRSLVVRAEGRLAEAEQLCETTIAEARNMGLDRWLAHPLYVHGLLARDRGDFKQASQAVAEGLSLLANTDELAMIAQCHHFLGELSLLAGNLPEARAQLERSLQLSQQVGILRRVAATQRLLGDLARLEGRYEEAEEIYHAALGLVTQLGDRPQMAQLLVSQARLKANLGQIQIAIDLLRGVISSYQEIGDVRGEVAGFLLLARLYWRQRKLGRALKLTLAAFRVIKSAGLLQPKILFNLWRRQSQL